MHVSTGLGTNYNLIGKKEYIWLKRWPKVIFDLPQRNPPVLSGGRWGCLHAGMHPGWW